METCLQYGGEQRIRIKLTVATSGGGDTGDEVDVDLLRVSVYREAWEGLPGTWSAGKQPEDEKQAQQASGSVRLDPKDLKGFWNSFEVSSIMGELVENCSTSFNSCLLYILQSISPNQFDVHGLIPFCS